MRIWSVHPRYLDRQALIACWRETLLAQAVLSGSTRGYTHHPQLVRFREHIDPLAAVGSYLAELAGEADVRGYRFDRTRIRQADGVEHGIEVADRQLALEWDHLLIKLAARSPQVHERWASVTMPDPHPLFDVVVGDVADWERAEPRRA